MFNSTLRAQTPQNFEQRGEVGRKCTDSNGWVKVQWSPNDVYDERAIMVSDLLLVVRLVGSHRILSQITLLTDLLLVRMGGALLGRYKEKTCVTKALPADCPHQILAFVGLHGSDEADQNNGKPKWCHTG